MITASLIILRFYTKIQYSFQIIPHASAPEEPPDFLKVRVVEFMMFEETGVVTRLDGAKAFVSVPKKSACEGCSAGTCRPEDQGMEIEAINRAHASPGQKVRVVVHTFPYMKGAIIVYGIPAVCLVIGAIAGKDVLSRFMPGRDPDILSAICGFGAFVSAFLGIKVWSSRRTAAQETQPVIEEILEEH